MSPAQILYTLLKQAFPDLADGQIGAAVGVTAGAVSQWKHGGGALRDKTIRAAARALCMTPGELYDELQGWSETPLRGLGYDPEAPPP